MWDEDILANNEITTILSCLPNQTVSLVGFNILNIPLTDSNLSKHLFQALGFLHDAETTQQNVILFF